MTEQPSVSVVIPCYNAGRFLRETLESVLRQTAPPREVLVIDDGSTDDSAAVAASFGPPVRVIRQPNQGESVARNRGISEAKGEWVALLDADDLWEPQKLERQLEVAAGLPDTYACIYTDYYKFEGATRIACEPLPEYHDRPDARVSLLFDFCVHISSVLIRRDALRTVRFPETVRYGEDPIFFALLREQGPFRRVPEELTGYRMFAAQQSKGAGYHDKRVRSLVSWFRDNEGRYSAAERDYFYNRVRFELTAEHDIAYYGRRHTRVGECRALFRELFGPDAAPPPLFRKRLLPRVFYRIKDWFDGVFGTRSSTPSSHPTGADISAPPYAHMRRF